MNGYFLMFFYHAVSIYITASLSIVIIFFTDYNECSANPCTNGGTCYNLINAYECSCPVGFAGKHCDVGK